jgi:hypothetical protein
VEQASRLFPGRLAANASNSGETPTPAGATTAPLPDWLRGAAEGRSFVTSGPMLLLEVDGQKPGARLKKTGPGPHTVNVRVQVRCEVTPVTQVEQIVNGEVVQ